MELPEFSSNSTEKKNIEYKTVSEKKLSACCMKTIDELASNNPMMSCQSCCSLIKCFTDINSYHNYINFCSSKKRNITKLRYKEYFVAIYNKHFDLYKN